MWFMGNPQGALVAAAEGGGAAPPAPPVTDYYIGPSGNDTAAGTSEGAAWASFAPLITVMQAAADDTLVSCRVLEGTYADKGPGTIGTSINNGCALTVYIDADTIFTGPTGVDRSWINVTGNLWTMEIKPSIDPGQNVQTWTIQTYDTGTGNGIGMDSAGGATLTVRNVLVQGCVDGWSCHGTNPQSYVYDSVFKSCSKSAASHVHTAGTMQAARCEFWGNSGGSSLGIYFETTAASANTDLDTCKFIPTGTVSTECNCDFRGATLTNCQLGTTTLPLNLVGSAETNLINDSYMNAFWDMNRAVTLTRCYGLASPRMRNSANTSTLSHCAFTGPATGKTSGAPFRNFDPGSSAQWLAIDTVLRGYTTAVGQGYGVADAAYWLAADCAVTNCCLFGNTTNVDADIVTADPTSITNTVTSDPQMGSYAGSYVQVDYAVSAAGPCAGAGTGGSNIGFTSTDI